MLADTLAVENFGSEDKLRQLPEVTEQFVELLSGIMAVLQKMIEVVSLSEFGFE